MARCIVELLAVVCLAASAAVADQSEPTYQGRTLSDWTREIDPCTTFGYEPPAWAAIRHMGTNTIPTLLRWMSESDPPEPPKPHLAPCFNMSRSKRAEMAFSILGETARPAIPRLTKLALTLTNRNRYDGCIGALAYIGPASLPSFNAILTAGTPDRRFAAMDWLPAIHTNCGSLLPALLECLVSKNADVGWKAADAIGGLGVPASVVVPALTNALPTASAPARARIFRCLYWLNVSAPEAVPAIRTGLSDPNSEVRTNATYAAERIAPELLTKHEAKKGRRP